MAEATEGKGFTPVADPAPLGLAAFALATLMLSGHNASFIPDGPWVGLAIFQGGLVQLLAGMWEFRNRNVFGATAFATYGGFWLSLGLFKILATVDPSFASLMKGTDELSGLAWFLISFTLFNTYMLIWATRLNLATTLLFLTLEITEILLVIGFFKLAHGTDAYWLHAGGWAGIVTALVAFYASAAGVVNGMSSKQVVPVGEPIWRA